MRVLRRVLLLVLAVIRLAMGARCVPGFRPTCPLRLLRPSCTGWDGAPTLFATVFLAATNTRPLAHR